MQRKKLFIHDLFTEFEFEQFSNTDNVDNSVKLEYIKEMISFAKNDKQAVFMYFGFSLGAIVFLVDKLDAVVSSIGYSHRALFYMGITLLGLCYFLFYLLEKNT